MGEKKQKRKIQAEDTKRRIYESAIALMKKNGYHGTTVEQISRAAGVSVGAFYHHFPSKLDIFSITYEEADRYFITVVTSRMELIPEEDRIVKYFRMYAEYNQSLGVELMKVLYNSDNKWFVKKGRSMQDVLDKLLCSARERGFLPADAAVEMINESLFILARGVIYDWCLHNGSYSMPDVMEALIARLVRDFFRENA